MSRTSPAPALPPEPVVAGRDAPVAEHVRAALNTRLRGLLAHDPGTRLGADPEELHQMRVSVRRMRAVLRSARPFLDTSWSEPLRTELGALGHALGPVRDLDVLLDRLRQDIAELDTAERSAAARLVSGLEVEHGEARFEMLAVLDGERYEALVNALREAVRAPLPTAESGAHGRRELRALVAKQYRKLRSAVDAAGREPSDERLHELRILGKRLRYTAELAEPALGKPMKKLLSAAKDFQDVLGAHQDACVAQQRVRDLLAGLGEQVDPAVTFVAGRLVERDSARCIAQRERWWAAWRDLRATAAKV